MESTLTSDKPEPSGSLDRYPTIPVSDARATISDLVEQVAIAGERHVLTRHGRPVAALVCIPDLVSLEEIDSQALSRLEWPDKEDIEDEVQQVGATLTLETCADDLRVEFEDLVRRTMEVLTHDPKLKTMMVEFLEKD
ncbi:MAG: type II toxin-antitoxin system Phd/YefM family antitoxin [Bacteroidota bacterium]